MPRETLGFRSIVVASNDDPYCDLKRARVFARAWGSVFVAIGGAGHINAASGLGDWKRGRSLLDELMDGTAVGR
jgi:predicted alpha/beta hydrolase family esterase